MYKKGELEFGSAMDTSTDDYETFDDVAYLPHSCNEWVIGGAQQIQDLIDDLADILKKFERGEKGEK